MRIRENTTAKIQKEMLIHLSENWGRSGTEFFEVEAEFFFKVENRGSFDLHSEIR